MGEDGRTEKSRAILEGSEQGEGRRGGSTVRNLGEAAREAKKRRGRERTSAGGGGAEEPVRSCRCSRRPTAVERRSWHFGLHTNNGVPESTQRSISEGVCARHVSAVALS